MQLYGCTVYTYSIHSKEITILPCIRSYMVQVYTSGQPNACFSLTDATTNFKQFDWPTYLQDAHRTQHHATLLSVCYPIGRNYQWSSLAAHADFLVVMAYDMQVDYCIM